MCKFCRSLFVLLYFFFWPLCCLFCFDLRLLITPLVSSGHCVVCPSIYGFWLPLWYLLAIVLSVLLFTASDYPFGIFWPVCCLSFFDIRILITTLETLPTFLDIDIRIVFVPLENLLTFLYIDIQILFAPLVSSNSSFVLFLLTIVLYVLPRYTDCDYPFGIINYKI